MARTSLKTSITVNDAPIGIIDSGLGGLTVWQSIRALLPYESTVYVGDHAFVPYGTKSRTMIRKRILQILRYLRKCNTKLVVIACNTATVAGIDWYRTQMRDIPIIGVVPVIKTAGEISKTKKFIVLSTNYTTKSSYQKELIKKFASDCNVQTIAASPLVDLVEKGETESESAKRTIRTMVKQREMKDADVVVLGSTHFAFLGATIRAMLGSGVAVLDSGGAVSRQVGRVLEARGELVRNRKATHLFITTGNTQKVSRVATKLMGTPMTFVYAKL